MGAAMSVIFPEGSRTVTRSSGVECSPGANRTISIVWLIDEEPSSRSSTTAGDCDRTSKAPHERGSTGRMTWNPVGYVASSVRGSTSPTVNSPSGALKLMPTRSLLCAWAVAP